MVDDDEQGMSDGNRGLLASPPDHQTVILRSEVAIFAVDGRMCRLDQRSTQPGTPFTGSTAQALARALIVAWTHACPHSVHRQCSSGSSLMGSLLIFLQLTTSCQKLSGLTTSTLRRRNAHDRIESRERETEQVKMLSRKWC